MYLAWFYRRQPWSRSSLSCEQTGQSRTIACLVSQNSTLCLVAAFVFFLSNKMNDPAYALCTTAFCGWILNVLAKVRTFWACKWIIVHICCCMLCSAWVEPSLEHCQKVCAPSGHMRLGLQWRNWFVSFVWLSTWLESILQQNLLYCRMWLPAWRCMLLVLYIDIQKLREQVVTEIRSNQALENDLNEMDIKIGLLVRNRITLQVILFCFEDGVVADIGPPSLNLKSVATISRMWSHSTRHWKNTVSTAPPILWPRASRLWARSTVSAWKHISISSTCYRPIPYI